MRIGRFACFPAREPLAQGYGIAIAFAAWYMTCPQAVKTLTTAQGYVVLFGRGLYLAQRRRHTTA